MNIHSILLNYKNNELNSKDETPGPLEIVKSQVCDNIALYAGK